MNSSERIHLSQLKDYCLARQVLSQPLYDKAIAVITSFKVADRFHESDRQGCNRPSTLWRLSARGRALSLHPFSINPDSCLGREPVLARLGKENILWPLKNPQCISVSMFQKECWKSRCI